MLKWTSSSSLGNKNNVRNYPKEEGTDSPDGENSLEGKHTKSNWSNTLVDVRGRSNSFNSSHANWSGNLPFSYTDPVSSHRPEYPYLTRLDLHNTTERKAVPPVTKNADVTANPTPLFKPSQDGLSRSKSMPRLGSPVSSTSSFGGAKKGILSKVKRVFRRSKGKDVERRSLSQPSSPKNEGLSSLSTKLKDKSKTPVSDMKKSKVGHPEMPSTRLTRRMELRKSQRKKIDKGKETPLFNSTPMLDIGDTLEDEIAAYEETKWNLTKDCEEDCYEGISQQQQSQPTFDTFKSSIPLPSDTDSGDAYNEDQTSKRRRHLPADDQIPDTRQQCQSSPSQSASSSGSVTSYSTSVSFQPTPLEESVLDRQVENNVKVARPRSSYSRISNLSAFEEDSKRHINQVIGDSTAICQERSQNLLHHDSMNSLLNFAEELAETLAPHADISDSYHALEPEMKGANNHPCIETKINTIVNTINEADFQKEVEFNNEDEELGTNVKDEETGAEHLKPIGNEINQADIISFSQDSPENSDWSLEEASHISLSVREQNASCGVDPSKMHSLVTGGNSFKLELIDILEKTLNDRDRSTIASVRTGAIHEPFIQHLEESKANETDSNSHISLSLSSVCTQSSPVSSTISHPYSEGVVAASQSKEALYCHKVTNAKNNNNGHSSFLRNKFQLERENFTVSADGEEKMEVKDFDWSEIKRNVHTDYVIGMARQDHLKPEMHENSTKSIDYSPMRVKNIVHQLEEQIKIKLDHHKDTKVSTSNSQEIHPQSEKVGARKSFSTSVVNEHLIESKNTTNTVSGNKPSPQVTATLKNDLTRQESPFGASSESGSLYQCTVNKKCDGVDISFADADSLPSASDEIAMISNCGNNQISRDSVGSDTHSMCSDVMGGFSSDEAPDIYGASCEISSSQERNDRTDREEISMSYLAAKIAKSFEIFSIPRTTEENKNRSVDRNAIVSSVAPLPSPDLPPATPVACDFTEDKGITDVTPPGGLVESSINSENSKINQTHWKRKYGGQSGPDTSQFFQKQGNASGESGFTENIVETSSTILKKRESILSPSCKPPSPIKKTVSFKLDRTPTPSTSPSTVSDDAAICETIPSRPKQSDEEPKQEKPPIHQISDNSVTDHTVTTDECPAVPSSPSKSDAPSGRTVQTNSLSTDDLSWWGADSEEYMGLGNQTRREEKLSSNAQDTTDLNSCDKSTGNLFVFKKDKSDTVLSTKIKHFPENNKSVIYPISKKNHNLVKSPSPDKNTEESSSIISRKVTQIAREKFEHSFSQREPLQINNQQESSTDKNDGWLEMSDSSSNLYTYNVAQKPKSASKDLVSKSPQDDNIDGLLVDVDVSSALSDLVDQVESSGLKDTSPPTSPGTELTHTALDESNRNREKSKDTLLGNVPFWEKRQRKDIAALRKKVFSARNRKTRPVKPNNIGPISKREPLAQSNKNTTEGQEAKPKRRTFRYRLVKSSRTKTEEITAKTDDKDANEENKAIQGCKESSNSKGLEQVMGKFKLHAQADQPMTKIFDRNAAVENKATGGLKENSKKHVQSKIKLPVQSVAHQAQSKKALPSLSNESERAEKENKKHNLPIVSQPTVLSKQTRNEVSKSMTMPAPTTSKAKLDKGSPRKNTARSSIMRIQKETPTRGRRTCETQTIDRASQIFEKNKPDIEYDQNHFTRSSIPSGNQDGTEKTIVLATKPTHSMSAEAGDWGLNQTLPPDSGSTLAVSSDSSPGRITEDGESSNKSFSPHRDTVSAQYSLESATESDDTAKSLYDSDGDLTYRKYSKRDLCRWQHGRHGESDSPDTDHCNIPYHPKSHASQCSCNQRLESSRQSLQTYEMEAPALGRAHESHRADNFQTDARTDQATDSAAPSATLENRPGEWLFIATFFLLQVLLHWLNAANKST